MTDDSDARFIASRLATAAAPAVGVDTRADPLMDLESLVAGSDDDDDGHMSAGGDETYTRLGVATRFPPIAAPPPRPASLLEIEPIPPFSKCAILLVSVA